MNDPFPPAPEGWNKTLSDLNEELKRGERQSVGNPEMHWAREYERSQIPTTIRFPKKGDRLVVDYQPADSKPIGASLKGVNHKDLEARIVPSSIRRGPRYGGISFLFDTVDLNNKFKLTHHDQPC